MGKMSFSLVGFVRSQCTPDALSHFLSSQCTSSPHFSRYGEELLKLERITLDCIQDALSTIAATRGQPFNPRDCIQELVLQVLAVMVRVAS